MLYPFHIPHLEYDWIRWSLSMLYLFYIPYLSGPLQFYRAVDC